MAGKARVHELAKELKVRAKDVLAFLESDGERAKSASSTVEAPVARRVREFFATEIQTALPVVKASSADPTPAGMALVNLAQELGVREQAVIGYLGHLGVDTQDLSIGLLQEHSERLRERFSPVTRRSVAGDGRPDERSAKTRPDGGRSRRSADAAGKPSEPPSTYLFDCESAIVHHSDYLGARRETALCGLAVIDRFTPAVANRAKGICPDCVTKLAEYHAKWWKDRAKELSVELSRVKGDCRKLGVKSEEQRRQIVKLSKKLAQPKPKPKSKPQRKNAPARSQGRATVRHEGNSGQPKKLADASARRPQKRLSPRISPPAPKSVRRVPDPEVVRKRIKEMNAPRRPKTEAEKRSDEAARESMRGYKPSTWRIGRSPSSFG